MVKVSKKLVKINKLKKDGGDKITLLQSPTEGRPPIVKVISKKEKFKQKHKNLLNKFAALKKARKEEIARKNREKTAVIGDLRPLKDALPSLDELFTLSKQHKLETTESTNDATSQKKPSIKQKIRQKRQQFINQTKSFEALLKDPEFKQNPRETIAYHIKYTHGLIE